MAQIKLNLAKSENIKRLIEKVRHLNVFITEINVATQAQELLANPELNNKPLAGLLVAVKDNFCTKGVQTTCASHMLHNYVPTYDATVCQRLKDAGALLIGKTNLDEFGMGSGTCDSLIGATKNVWGLSENEWHIAGGSSGGSAIAVATGVANIGIGSDTGGSTRNPASYCGVVGFKPTYGTVSRSGLIPLVNSMDVPGILTRTVDLCGLTYNVIGGRDGKDSTTVERFSEINVDKEPDIKNVTIGIPTEYFCSGLSPDVHKVWMKIADELEDSGAKVKTVSLPHTAASIFVYSILNQCEVASNMARYDGLRFGYRATGSSTEELFAATREKGFNSVVKGRILAGNYFLLRRNYEKYFEKALKVRRLIAQDFGKVFDGQQGPGVDVLLTPTTLTTAPTYEDFISKSNRDQCAAQDYCTQPANMAGIPALSLPITLSKEDLPISLQLMSDKFCEPKLFNVARWIEDRVNFKLHQEKVLV